MYVLRYDGHITIINNQKGSGIARSFCFNDKTSEDCMNMLKTWKQRYEDV